jgi:putative flippase GtrA
MKSINGRSLSLKKFYKFVVGGICNTAGTYLLYLGLIWCNFPYTVAYSMTFLFGILASYLVNCTWVFRVDDLASSFKQYMSIWAFQYVINILLLHLCVEILHFQKEMAPLLVIMITFPFNYLLLNKRLGINQSSLK